MAYQLRYTSVLAGLKPGTSGYTTVQHTQGMPDKLVTALESVPGYDHLAVRDPSFPANPSIYRYQILQLNASTFFVLSILQDSGSDHKSSRNYLAQHLVFEGYELNVLQQNPEINPASILRLSPDNVLWHQPGPVTAQYLPPLEINDLIGQLKAKGAEISIQDGAGYWRQCHLRTEQTPSLLEGGLQAKCCLSYAPGSEAHLLALFAETLRVAIEKPNESTGQDRSPQEAWRYTFNVFVQPGESHQDYVWCGLCGPALQEAAGQQVYDIFAGQLPAATNVRLLSFAETGEEPYVPPPEPVVPEQPQIVPRIADMNQIVVTAIREELKKPEGEITEADLEKVTTLVLYKKRQWPKITDAGLKEVSKLKQLKELFLGGGHITNAGLKEVAKLGKLSTLALADTQVTDAGLKQIGKLSQLTSLFLHGTQITDVGLKEIAKFKQLSGLNLAGTKATKAGVAQLQKALPKCYIKH
jgi:Leucine-rich repeat (LRR) protein